MVYNVAMDTLKTQYAWAAGFIDGEGTISIKRYFRTRKDGSRFIAYQPFVSLSQAVVGGHEQGVIKMKELFGGSISNYKDKRDNVRYPTMQWSVVSKNAMNCINLIYPYLVAKKDNANILLRYYKEIAKLKGGSGKIKLTQAECIKRENLYFESHILNQKGKLRLQRLSEITPKGDATV
jgi:hypothetical protein